jgi:hypothetical protein
MRLTPARARWSIRRCAVRESCQGELGRGTTRLCTTSTAHRATSASLVCRKRSNEYDASWWTQHEQQKAARKEKDKDKEKAPQAQTELKQAELEPRGPVVRAGYFEADIEARAVYPIYWPGEPRMLLRATWFVVSPGQQRTLIPLPHPLACTLEKAWLNRCEDTLGCCAQHWLAAPPQGLQNHAESAPNMYHRASRTLTQHAPPECVSLTQCVLLQSIRSNQLE